MLLSKSKAKSDGLTVGSPFPLTLTDGTPKTLTVQGIYEKDDLAGSITVDRELFAGSSVDQYDFGVFITKAKGVSELFVNPGAESDELMAEADRLGLNAVYACAIVDIGEHP